MVNDSNVTRLSYQDKEIILVATAHVSQQSVELVKQVIEEEHPDSVCVELDQDRYRNIKNPKTWENTDIVKVIRSKKVGFLITNLILSSYQRRLAKKLNTVVGGEMLQAIKSAEEFGATLVLADRNIQTTLLRLWHKLGLVDKAKLLGNLLFSFGEDTDISDQDLQDMLKEDMLESVVASMGSQFPQIREVLINERDKYLAWKIKNAPGQKIVAVLGGAHVPGVKRQIFEVTDIQSVTALPPKKPISGVIGWIIPAIIVALIVYSLASNWQTGIHQLSLWLIWTSTLAALFTALSLGHPLSIITSFVAAPFTVLHPVLAVGMFAGLVEGTIRKPTVQDVQNIPTDIFSLRGLFRNRFLKAILVFTMANLGGSIGTFIAGTNIIKNLF